jgi:CRISPR-associated protein Cas2
MVVLILENVPTRLRGELSRWMLEPKAGVFVGSVSGMVRDRLWEKVCKEARGGGCIMIHDTNREQGFAIKSEGESRRGVEDFEGLFLIRVPS